MDHIRVWEGPWKGDLARRTTLVPPTIRCKVQNTREIIAGSVAKEETKHRGAKE
jgi:hypothetical protein